MLYLVINPVDIHPVSWVILERLQQFGNTDTLLGHKFNIVISKLVLLVELYIKETIRKRFGCIYITPHFTHGYTNMVLLLKVQSKEATSKNLGHIDILS